MGFHMAFICKSTLSTRRLDRLFQLDWTIVFFSLRLLSFILICCEKFVYRVSFYGGSHHIKETGTVHVAVGWHLVDWRVHCLGHQRCRVVIGHRYGWVNKPTRVQVFHCVRFRQLLVLGESICSVGLFSHREHLLIGGYSQQSRA